MHRGEQDPETLIRRRNKDYIQAGQRAPFSISLECGRRPLHTCNERAVEATENSPGFPDVHGFNAGALIDSQSCFTKNSPGFPDVH
jgi:hypothetical protein